MASAPHLIIDDFLPKEVHDGILARTLALTDFAKGRVFAGGELGYDPQHRKGLLSDDRLGPYLEPFVGSLRAAFDDICPAIGMSAFAFSTIEIRLAAHNDGDFFSPHRDILTGRDRTLTSKDRIITAVYYFHRLPCRFSGGDLRLFPFDRSEPAVIEACDNRLVAFPSFLLHEVSPVSVPGNAFADSRFSVSSWFTRD
jgi:Rps23 Pro-64 3,4-dihydroxylase Tpa1-like proline 4-hydroxylase